MGPGALVAEPPTLHPCAGRGAERPRGLAPPARRRPGAVPGATSGEEEPAGQAGGLRDGGEGEGEEEDAWRVICYILPYYIRMSDVCMLDKL